MRNDRADTVEVKFGACNVGIDIFRTPIRGGEAVWRAGSSVCVAVLYVRQLMPGEEILLGAFAAPVMEILGDSLLDGHYYVRARVGSSLLPKGLVLPAGDVDLVLTRPPLPSSITHDVATYLVWDAPTVSGGVVSVHLALFFSHAEGSVVTVPRPCAIELVAYRDQRRRDEAPRSGQPDWRTARVCPAAGLTQTVPRGDGSAFEVTAAVRDVLGASLPSGRYYFAIVIHTPAANLWLSAGSAELRR